MAPVASYKDDADTCSATNLENTKNYRNNSFEKGEKTSYKNDSSDDSEQEPSSEKGKKKRSPKRRVSEKAKGKTVQELFAEKEKMPCDRVSLPYHKPKQLSLDAFLKKRHAAKSSLHSSLKNSNALGVLRGAVMKIEEVSVSSNTLDEKHEDMTSKGKEANVQVHAFLEAHKSIQKPRSRITEFLRSMPGYDKIANLKPQIGGTGRKNRQHFIELEDVKNPKTENAHGIESLKDRFVKHALVDYGHPKEEHHEVRIEETKEDSQDAVVVAANEVSPDQDNENELMAALKGTGSAPIPGEKYSRLKEVLEAQLLAKRARQYQKRQEDYAAYEIKRKLEEIEDDSENSSTESDTDDFDDQPAIRRKRKLCKR